MSKSASIQKSIKFLCLFFTSFLLSASCSVQSNQVRINAVNPVRSSETTLTNLQYAAALTGENPDSDVAVQENIPATKASEYVCKDANELSDTVRECMISRITYFSITYTGVSPENVLSVETFGTFLDTVFSYDDRSTSEDFDYLKLSWTKAQLNVTNTGNFIKYGFSFAYLTNSKEEEYIDRNIRKIVDALGCGDSSDYEKIRNVNDYIVQHVSFDNSNKHKSAYDAICLGKTVCRGYSMLAYKMLNELSVPVRIITGTASSKPHAWNLVEIKGKWYNLDVTWDDLTKSDSFFLKDDNDLRLHIKDTEFTTASFDSNYPLANESYKDGLK